MLNYCANCNKKLYDSSTFCSKSCETEYESFIDDITFRRPRLSMPTRKTISAQQISDEITKKVEEVLARHGI